MRLVIIFLCSILLQVTSAQVRLPKLISSGMVLQRDTKLKIWGWASSNEAVAVQFKGQSYKSKCDEYGGWMIEVPAQKAGGPYSMTIKASNEISLNNILIGDVWVCSGQSNMELMMERVKYKYPDEMLHANNANIRQFTIPDKYNFMGPVDDLESGTWQAVNTKNIASFSAVAYFFAKHLYAKYKVPIGLINTALGGSPAEAWISEDAIKKFPEAYQETQKFKDKNLIKEIETNDRRVSSNWYKKLNETDEGIKNNWKDPAIDDSHWKQISMPGYWADTDAGLFNGSAWFRKDVDVPQSMTGKPVTLNLGRIVDADSVFINGRFVGTTGYQYPPRRYQVPGDILKNGKNNITVRVISNSGRGGFVADKPYMLTSGNDTISLKGDWKFNVGAVMSELPGQTFIRWKPVGLYNAMIAPLINYPIKGAIWYQGESNASHPYNYKVLMQTLIEDWRSKWKQGNFPFIFVQLANFMETAPVPGESNWASLRQQQLNTLTVPNTGMVVAIDAGEWNDIHPLNKNEIGKRLALQAMNLAYGDKTIVPSGPLYRSMKKQGNKLVLEFFNTGAGLVAKGARPLNQFAIAGADKKYIWAKAIIKGNTVIVWNDSIKQPVAVRYAWADNPEGANLYNKEGLPASPFTTER